MTQINCTVFGNGYHKNKSLLHGCLLLTFYPTVEFEKFKVEEDSMPSGQFGLHNTIKKKCTIIAMSDHFSFSCILMLSSNGNKNVAQNGKAHTNIMCFIITTNSSKKTAKLHLFPFILIQKLESHSLLLK